MKFLGYNNVLCISAHPDDAEYGMLGTVLKYTDTTFHMVCLGYGGEHDDTTGPSRNQELVNIWQRVDNIIGYISPFAIVDQTAESSLINYVESELNVPFDCVAIPPYSDTHFEHKKVNNVGTALVRKKRASIVEYRTPSAKNEWIPKLYVDISSEYQRKVELLKLFTSQQTNFYFDENTIASFHQNYQCTKVGLKIAEQFNPLVVYT
jgi:LmbE family N-acetylglucosaminyl deacetylase